MTDRELLEAAAKAAGIEGGWKAHASSARYANNPSDKYEGFWTKKTKSKGRLWRPLTDDGDALRLAVKLKLEPRFIDNSHSNGVEPSKVTMHNIAGISEPITDDPCVALRRAIVRAAAAIGKEKT